MNNIVRFPRKIVTCRTCGTYYRLPPPGYCSECRKWQGEAHTLKVNTAALRGVQ